MIWLYTCSMLSTMIWLYTCEMFLQLYLSICHNVVDQSLNGKQELFLFMK